ncbi:PKD domain-containing protein [Kitasatospora sp. NPDC049258]|uniref:PKD domain-containing protein n=1 Tax=Kitasatospora sp. NPDC049258 TaxID=3155394 RepID=UPI00343662AC
MTETESSAFRTFNSPGSTSIRARNSTARPMAGGEAGSGRTIFASSTGFCNYPSGTGTGSQDTPFCKVQDAVDAAQSGDTVDVVGSMGYFTQDPVTVKTSGISIVGIGSQAWISPGGKPAITLDGVSDVTISNLMLSSFGAPAVVVKGSSRVTLDSSYVDLNPNVRGVDAITVDGASADVTVSRTYVDAGFWSAGASGISIAAGASRIRLASDVFAVAGITATGVNGLDVVGNTAQRGCSAAVEVKGASSGVHIENNLFEDANPNTDYMMGGFKSNCTSAGQAWAPDVVVSADSAAGTVADYNAFYVYDSDATALYGWAGTAYPTLAGFRAGSGQGAHDAIDTVQAGGVYFRPNKSANVDAQPRAGSAVIGSADPNAPGRLASDFYGTSPYTGRGAIQLANPNPGLGVSLSGKNTSAYGISLTAGVTSASVPLTVSIAWGDGSTETASGNGNTSVTRSHSYAKLGNYTVAVTVKDDSGITVSNSVAVTTAGSAYTAYGPTRLLDTRDGTGAAKPQPVQPYSSARVRIVGNGGIPSGVTAVVLNVTVTGTSSGGHITAYGEGDPRPSTSNVNFTAGQTVPNLVVVPVGANGYVDLYNGGWGAVDLIADITGYFTRSASSGYTPVPPARLVDTRNGTGAAAAQVAAYDSVPVQISGLGGLPGSGVTAVALNVTVTNPRSAGHLTVYPDGQATPVASNVNYGEGQTIANSVIVPVGPDGKIRVHNGGWAPTDVIVDVVGYYSPAGRSAYLPIDPERLLDTRDAASWGDGPVGGRGYVYMPLAAGHPDITGFVFNSTVTNTADSGHLTVSPDPNSLAAYQGGYASWPATPSVSTLNWRAGGTVPNLVQANAGSNGIVDFWNVSDGNLDLIVDMFGYYQND